MPNHEFEKHIDFSYCCTASASGARPLQDKEEEKEKAFVKRLKPEGCVMSYM